MRAGRAGEGPLPFQSVQQHSVDGFESGCGRMYMVSTTRAPLPFVLSKSSHSNVIFFNLWSACLLSKGNSVLPTFDQWSQCCSSNSLNINNPPFPGINAIALPPWATMTKPNLPNTTFDVGAAIMSKSFPCHCSWTDR
jgi:hypothetical protein